MLAGEKTDEEESEMSDEIMNMTPEEAYELGYTRGSKRDWIPCAEGLPKKCGEYRVTIIDDRCGARFGMNLCFNTNKQEWSVGYKSALAPCYSIIAWQPMPESYNPDQFREPTKMMDHIVDANKKMDGDPDGE